MMNVSRRKITSFMRSLIYNGSGKVKRSILDFIACYLIIVTHFTNYITYIGFTGFFPDIVLALSFLFGVALIITSLLQVPSILMRTGIFSLLIIIVLSDAIFEFGTTEGGAWLNIAILAMTITLGSVYYLREHINKVFIAVFTTMFVSTVALGPPISQVNILGENSPSTGTSALPVVVHLVLDEHMGVSGMTSRLPGGVRMRKELTSFYLRNKFRLFPRAYSEYFDTHTSLASVLNMNSDKPSTKHAVKNLNKYVLTKNGYFERWTKEGYKINVLQSSYLNLCKSKNIKINSCTTYKYDSFDKKSVSSLPLTDRIVLIGNMYLSSFTLFKLAQLSEKTLRRRLKKYDVLLPDFDLWHGRVGPLAISSPLDRFIRNVIRSKGGELFFAHLMIPHYPYAYDSSCQVKSPVSSWQLRTRGDGTNTPESRRSRYVAYFDQVRCTINKLQPLFDLMKEKGIFKNAIIIIHGDHGARITLNKPEARNKKSMTSDDYIDSFSTLFAIKAPDITAGIDERMASLPRLLAFVTKGHKAKLQEIDTPYVYLNDGGIGYVKTPISVFPPSIE